MKGFSPYRDALRFGLVVVGLCGTEASAQSLFPVPVSAPNNITLSVSVPMDASSPESASLVLSGGAPGAIPIVFVSSEPGALSSGALVGASVHVFRAAPFSAAGRVEIELPRPAAASMGGTVFMRAVALSLDEDPDVGGTSNMGLFPSVGTVGNLAHNVFCLFNFEIDDPDCSTTALGTNVGMMLEDSFGFDQVYAFGPGARYIEALDGQTVNVSGQIISIANPSYAWEVRIVSDDLVLPGDPDFPPDSPYFGFGPLKNCPFYLVANGGTIDPDTWRFFQNSSGALLGLDGYAGAEATLTRTGPAFQVGEAANTTNLQFGIGAWYDLVYTTQPLSGADPLPMSGPVNCELFGQVKICPTGGAMSTTPQ